MTYPFLILRYAKICWTNWCMSQGTCHSWKVPLALPCGLFERAAVLSLFITFGKLWALSEVFRDWFSEDLQSFVCTSAALSLSVTTVKLERLFDVGLWAWPSDISLPRMKNFTIIYYKCTKLSKSWLRPRSVWLCTDKI